MVFVGQRLNLDRAKLTSDGVPAQRALGWDASTILTILERDYSGRWTFGKVNTSKGVKGKKRKIRQADPAALVSCEVPAIIERETWQAAQRLRVSNRTWLRGESRNQYLLSGHAWCACGRAITFTAMKSRNNARWARCNYSHRPSTHDECACRFHMNCDMLERDVWDWLKNQFLTPASIRDFIANTEANMRRLTQDQDSKKAKARGEIETIKAQMERLLDLYVGGDLDRDAYKARQAKLQAKLEMTQASLPDADEQPTPEQMEAAYTYLWGKLMEAHPDQAEAMLLEYAEMKRAAMDEMSFEERRKLLRDLGVELRATGKHSYRITARCRQRCLRLTYLLVG